MKKNKLLYALSKTYRQVFDENVKVKDLLSSTWLMLGECHLDFNNGISCNGVDEGYTRGWAIYRSLDDLVQPYLKRW